MCVCLQVSREIVAGLKYHHVTHRKGISGEFNSATIYQMHCTLLSPFTSPPPSFLDLLFLNDADYELIRDKATKSIRAHCHLWPAV